MHMHRIVGVTAGGFTCMQLAWRSLTLKPSFFPENRLLIVTRGTHLALYLHYFGGFSLAEFVLDNRTGWLEGLYKRNQFS